MDNNPQARWENCTKGSCHRHKDCMYTPCRSIKVVKPMNREYIENTFNRFLELIKWRKPDRLDFLSYDLNNPENTIGAFATWNPATQASSHVCFDGYCWRIGNSRGMLDSGDHWELEELANTVDEWMGKGLRLDEVQRER